MLLLSLPLGTARHVSRSLSLGKEAREPFFEDELWSCLVHLNAVFEAQCETRDKTHMQKLCG